MRKADAPRGTGDPGLLSLAHDAVIGRSSAGEITFWNRGAEECYGWTAAEAVGRSAWELLQVAPSMADAIERSLAEDGMWEGELRHVIRDGSVLTVASRQVVRGDVGTDPVAVLEINRDVTEAKKAEARLRESEERFRLMVEGVQDYAIFMLDVDGIVVSWNAGAERIKGYSAEEACGMHFSSFYPPEDVDAGKPGEELRVAAAEGRVEDEGWRVRKDGSRFWAMVVITALRDSSGTLRGFGKVTRDFTERRRYEERLAYHARLLDQVNDAVLATDENLVLTAWNAAAERLYGWRAEEVLGRPLADVLDIDLSPSSREEALHVLREGGEWRGEVSSQHRDGRRVDVEAAAIVLRDGPTRIVSVNRDVSERKQRLVSAERGRIARELHDSVSQALFSLNLQARALQLAIQRDGHEPTRPVTDGVANILELTSGALAEMRSLIFELRPGALAEEGLVAALRKHGAAMAAKEGLVVEISASSEPLTLEAAVEENLYRLAQEALSNVAKHAGASKVTVCLVAEPDSPEIELEVSDDGAGFDPQSRRPGHLGLGTMAERAAALGGHLSVTSAPGAGTTVRVSVPRR